MGATLEAETCDESSDEEEPLLSYQEDSVSAIACESASLIIDTLYQLSFRIRNSTTRARFSESGPSSQVNEDTWIKPEEDRQLKEKISNVPGIYHQRSFPIQGSFKQIDKDEVHENETDDNEFDVNVKGWDITAPMSVTSPRETRQKDSRRFESSLEGVNESTERRRDKKTLDSPYPGLEPDNAPLYQGGSGSNTPVSEVRQQPGSYVGSSNRRLPKACHPGKADNVSFFVLIDCLEPNDQAQKPQYGPHGAWFPLTIE